MSTENVSAGSVSVDERIEPAERTERMDEIHLGELHLGDIDTVQLLTPEGSRLSRRTLRLLGGRRRRRAAARAVRGHGGHPPHRHRGDRPAAPGRAGALAAAARPGGRAGRLRPSPPPRRLRLLQLPRERCRLLPRRRPHRPRPRVARHDALRAGTRTTINMATPQVIIGAQTLHATGYAIGIQNDGSDAVAVAYFGDGATSEGDVNEAMIFAATYSAPVIFFCQNNQWAISEPVALQAQRPIAERAPGFGIPSVRVDGNDVLAVMAVTRLALDRARGGGGPTFIEAVTYRMGPHTTADDPTRYRDAAEVETWRAKDPIARLEALPDRHAACSPTSAPRPCRRRRMRWPPNCAPAASRFPTPSRWRSSTTCTPSAHRDRPAARPLQPLPPHVRRRRHDPERSARPARNAPAGQEGIMTTLTMAKAINAGLRRSLADDDKVVLMGEDIGKLGGVYRVTDGLQSEFGRAPGHGHAARRVRHPRHRRRARLPRVPPGRARSSSTASSTRRSTRSSARWRACTTARAAR